jgi:hypothetical protein
MPGPFSYNFYLGYGATNAADNITVLFDIIGFGGDVLYTLELSLPQGQGQADEFVISYDYNERYIEGIGNEYNRILDISLLPNIGQVVERAIFTCFGLAFKERLVGVEYNRLADSLILNNTIYEAIYSTEHGQEGPFVISNYDFLTAFEAGSYLPFTNGDVVTSYDFGKAANVGYSDLADRLYTNSTGFGHVFVLAEKLSLFDIGAYSFSAYPTSGKDTLKSVQWAKDIYFPHNTVFGYVPSFYAFSRQGLSNDTISVSDSSVSICSSYITEVVNLFTSVKGIAHTISTVTDVFSSIDSGLASYVRTFLDSVTPGDVYRVSSVFALSDLLPITDTHSSTVSRLALATLTASVLDAVVKGTHEQVSDTSTIVDSSLFSLAVLSHDVASLLDAPVGHIRVTLETQENVSLHDSSSTTVAYRQLISDSLFSSVYINLGAEQYVGYVLSTHAPHPISTYSNFPFNSLAEFNGQYYAAAEDGVYRLFSSDTDQGQPIQATIRTLLFDFIKTNLKAFQTAYLGWTSSGDLYLKLRTTDQTGTLTETIYKVESNASRVKIGKGLRSRYWQFELVNIDGADFDIDVIEFHPVLLTRRVL